MKTLINYSKFTTPWNCHGWVISRPVSYMGNIRVENSARKLVSCFVVFLILSQHLQSSYHFKIYNTTTWEMSFNNPRRRLKGNITLNRMEQSPCWEVQSHWAGLKIPSLLWNPKAVTNSTNGPCPQSCHHIISLSSTRRPSSHVRQDLPTESLHVFELNLYISPHACYMSSPSHPSDPTTTWLLISWNSKKFSFSYWNGDKTSRQPSLRGRMKDGVQCTTEV